jgi:hypothetical protein
MVRQPDLRDLKQQYLTNKIWPDLFLEFYLKRAKIYKKSPFDGEGRGDEMEMGRPT